MDRGIALAICILTVSVVQYGDAEMVFRQNPSCGTNHAHNAPRSRATVKTRQECENLCAKFDNCRSYQISGQKKKCQLLKRTAGTWARRMAPKNGWIYREKYSVDDRGSCQKFPFRTCSPIIDSVSNQIMLVRGGTWQGFYRESLIPNGSYWYIPNFGNERTIHEFVSQADYWNNIYVVHSLPFGCHGLQAVFRDNKLWCKEYTNHNIVVYDLIEQTILTRISFDSVYDDLGVNNYAGHSNQCPYSWGGSSDIDVVSDYGGAVYAIWGRHNNNCFLAASEINPDTYEIEETHWLNHKKNDFGNAFAVCGRLYFTAFHNDDPSTWFELIWDLRTGNYTYLYHDMVHMTSRMQWPARHNYNAMMDFNPLDEKIYKTSNARPHNFKVKFAPQPADLWEGSDPPYRYWNEYDETPQREWHGW